MADKFVIYQDNYNWNGAAEFEIGRWPFKKIQHAPVVSAKTPEQVFAWLLERYADRVIAYDPSVSERYRRAK